jgi:hypothetical protein
MNTNIKVDNNKWWWKCIHKNTKVDSDENVKTKTQEQTNENVKTQTQKVEGDENVETQTQK